MTRLLIAAAVAALAVPAVAQVAQPAPAAPPAPMKMRMGPMADGAMTLPEMQAKIAQMFARHDANKDGALTKEEMAAKMGKKRMTWTGKDGEKMVMREGPMGDPNALFAKLDTNKDGMLSRDEFAKGREMRIERRIEMKGDRAPGTPRERMGERMGQMMKMHHGMGGMGMMHGQMFDMADANKDGRVTLAEAQGAAARHFAMADTNRDGKVTRDEMMAMHQKMGGMNHGG